MKVKVNKDYMGCGTKGKIGTVVSEICDYFCIDFGKNINNMTHSLGGDIETNTGWVVPKEICEVV